MSLVLLDAARQMALPASEIERIVRAALAEDLPWGDLTTDNLIPANMAGVARIEAREPGVLAGLPLASVVFQTIDPDVQFEFLVTDGTHLTPRQAVASIQGPISSLLKAERVSLNFLQRLSGIATAANRYVQAVAGLPVRIIDTRKTTPGLRLVERYAVRMGGASNHRYCLSDGVLVKDNHLAALRRAGMTLRDALADARSRLPHLARIEVEAESLEEVDEALAASADVILLDNMSVAQMAEAVRRVGKRALTEASGSISLHSIRMVAETGVDLISIGALTHSVKALDLSLELD